MRNYGRCFRSGYFQICVRGKNLSQPGGMVHARRFILGILMVVFMSGSSATAQEAGDVAGDWIGQMNGGFKVRIHFEKTEGGFGGKLINPSGNETTLDQVTSDGTHLHFAVNKLNLSFDGVWNAQEKFWQGNLTFQQVFPLTLRRATAEELSPTVHKRPQEEAIAAQGARFVQKGVKFKNFAGHNELAGTLSLPSGGTGPFPAVVLISGTGRNTRDEDVFGHKVFLILAEALNHSGIAVLRYDKRGVGGSTGDYTAATTADFTSDAAAAVAWLRTQAEVDPKRIGVLGHSEGGIIAPAVAAADKSMAFVVMIAGPCIRGDRLFVLQSAMTAKAYGAPDDYIERRKVFDQELYDAIVTASSEADALAKAKALVARGVQEKIVDPNEAGTLAQEDSRAWERYFLAYDPAPTLTRVTVPVLVLNGSLDVQVPAKENLAAARDALKNNANATVLELPGLNHLLQDAKTGAPSEYNDIEETMSPEALKIITAWVKAKTLSTAVR
jgi:uncharacterized protein